MAEVFQLEDDTMEFASNFSTNTSFEAPPFRIFSQRNLKDLDYIERLTEELSSAWCRHESSRNWKKRKLRLLS